MDITFKDTKKQRRWTYTGLKSLEVGKQCMIIRGFDDLINKDYSVMETLDNFDIVELEKSEDEV